MNKELISIVLPVYNETAGIQKTIDVLLDYCQNRPEHYELIFVNDGSTDQTETILKENALAHPSVRLVSFSRNFGQQLAISAGLHYAQGTAVVVMDADLQDPPSIIATMIDKWHQGYDVVAGQRQQREGETFFKKASASLFYRLLRQITSVHMPLDTGDFRLMDRRVVTVLNQMPETDPFLRGMVSWLGFKQTTVHYVRQERASGETKYTLRKMLKLATDGLVSFSMVPLKLAQWLGGLLLLGALASLIVGVVNGFTLGVEIALFSLMIGGFILITLGILGNYVGRIFMQSRGRPLYVVSETYGFDEQITPQHQVSHTSPYVLKKTAGK
ncbi:glycosyltransferase family 2 protein [Agrilactobacillus composti]|nr:glycosyltransferase family 2 protein [Agrilactobacillus composti]